MAQAAGLSVSSYGVLGTAGYCLRRNDMGSMMGDFQVTVKSWVVGWGGAT